MIKKIELLLSNTDCMELTTDNISLFEINGINVLKEQIPESISDLKIRFKLDFKNMAYHKSLGWGAEDYRYLYESKDTISLAFTYTITMVQLWILLTFLGKMRIESVFPMLSKL